MFFLLCASCCVLLAVFFLLCSSSSDEAEASNIDLKNSISGRSDSTGLSNTGTCIVGDVVSMELLFIVSDIEDVDIFREDVDSFREDVDSFRSGATAATFGTGRP